MNPKRIQAIARKEFYHLIRDFRSLYLAFIIPLLLILLFGYALSLDVENVKTVVVDQDNTVLSRDFIRRLDASVYFKVIGRLSRVSDVADYLDSGRATMGLIFHPGWSADIRADRTGALQILLDGTDPNTAGISRGYVTAFIETYNQKRRIDFLNRQGLEKIRPPV